MGVGPSQGLRPVGLWSVSFLFNLVSESGLSGLIRFASWPESTRS